MIGEDLPDFVRPLPSLTEPCEPTRLSPDAEADVRRRLREFAEHRARAAIAGRSYLILGAEPDTAPSPAAASDLTHSLDGPRDERRPTDG